MHFDNEPSERSKHHDSGDPDASLPAGHRQFMLTFNRSADDSINGKKEAPEERARHIQAMLDKISEFLQDEGLDEEVSAGPQGFMGLGMVHVQCTPRVAERLKQLQDIMNVTDATDLVFTIPRPLSPGD